jgi:hypothetical protein
MSNDCYGPLAFLIGKWSSKEWTGENRAPDPNREVENTKFKQEMIFEPIGEVENHEQILYGLRYSTKAWEEGAEDEKPFHEEVGYWLWDEKNKQIMKSFNVPRGISVTAGGTADANSNIFEMAADVGSETYGICSNKFLDEEFKSIRYELKIEKINENSFRYDEDTLIKIKGQKDIFHHTEKNVLFKIN